MVLNALPAHCIKLLPAPKAQGSHQQLQRAVPLFPIPSMLYIPAAFFKPIHKIITVIVATLMICPCILMIEKKDPVMGGNTKHCFDKGAMDLRIEWFCLDKENKL